MFPLLVFHFRTMPKQLFDSLSAPAFWIAIAHSFFCGSVWLAGPKSINAFETIQDADLKRFTSEIDKLTARKAPVDDESLDAWYKANTSRQNTDAWTKLYQELQRPAVLKLAKKLDDELKVQPNLRDGGVEYLTLARELVRECRDNLDTIYRLCVDAKPIQAPLQFESYDTLLPHLEAMQWVSRMLDAEFAVAMADDNAKGRARVIATQFRLGSVMQNQPGLVGESIRMRCRSRAFENLQWALEANVLSNRDAKNLLDLLLQQPRSIDAWKNAVATERAFGLVACANPKYLEILYPDLKNFKMVATFKDRLNYLQLMSDAENIDVQSPDKFLSELKRIEDQISAKTKLRDKDWVFTGMLIPAFNAGAVPAIKDAIMQRQAELALQIRMHQQTKGGFPISLNALQENQSTTRSFALPGDKDFGYKVLGRTAILWGPTTSKTNSFVAVVPRHTLKTADESKKDPGAAWSIFVLGE
jgi:hypothetical protein